MAVTPPVVNGKIVQWDNMERIWHHIFYRELKAAPEDRAVLLCLSPGAPIEEKIKCCQVFFEALNVPALCMQSTSVLALYGSGFTTGITIDLGWDSTDINPAYEGGLIHYAQMSTNYAGEQICKFYRESLASRGIDLGCDANEIIDAVMMNEMNISIDCSMPRRPVRKYAVDPRTKQKTDVTDETFMVSEMFFQPDLVMGYDTGYMPLHKAFLMASQKCDMDIRDELNNAVVLCGGLSMIPGLAERFRVELTDLVEKPVTVLTSDESYVVSWMGGATFAGIPEAQRMWVTRQQFQEYGARVVKNRMMF
ncbi:actin-like isoform X2 [Pectinophora gossypiella]|nr:actin-like isoform X2 [Pectinophora gossypiella]